MVLGRQIGPDAKEAAGGREGFLLLQRGGDVALIVQPAGSQRSDSRRRLVRWRCDALAAEQYRGEACASTLERLAAFRGCWPVFKVGQSTVGFMRMLNCRLEGWAEAG